MPINNTTTLMRDWSLILESCTIIDPLTYDMSRETVGAELRTFSSSTSWTWLNSLIKEYIQIVIKAKVVIVWEITNNTFGFTLPTMSGIKPKNNVYYQLLT